MWYKVYAIMCRRDSYNMNQKNNIQIEKKDMQKPKKIQHKHLQKMVTSIMMIINSMKLSLQVQTLQTI